MERCERGSQRLKVVSSSHQRKNIITMRYQQLTEGKNQIPALLELGISISEITNKIKPPMLSR